jgi:DNA-directed RNA polymerase specialized sigma24 family protein
MTVLCHDERIIQFLRQICARFTSDVDLQADLMQECLIHLWRMELAKPNQTRSWYLQSCRFQVQHWLAAGRSLDNPRRSNGEGRISIDGDSEHPALGEHHTNGELFETVCFEDTVSTLAGHLGQRQRKVLNGLADGRTLSEIASQAKLSYPTVLKYRRAIADLSTKLGIDQRVSPNAGSCW